MTTRENLKAPAVDALVVRREIEDQICDRLPTDQCWSEGYGDKVHQAIRIAASAVDRVAGTKLEEKAAGCTGCARRRKAMNARFGAIAILLGATGLLASCKSPAKSFEYDWTAPIEVVPSK